MRLFDDDENIVILASVCIIFFAGVILSFIEGYMAYIVGYTALLSILIFAIVAYILISYSRSLNPTMNYEIEMSKKLGHSPNGQPPTQKREYKEFSGVY